jgi:hypothetical protein
MSIIRLIAEGLLWGQLPFDYVWGAIISRRGIISMHVSCSRWQQRYGGRAIALTYASAGFYSIHRICKAAGLET